MNINHKMNTKSLIAEAKGIAREDGCTCDPQVMILGYDPTLKPDVDIFHEGYCRLMQQRP